MLDTILKGGHPRIISQVEWRVGMLDTILKGDHPRTISQVEWRVGMLDTILHHSLAKFFSDFREEYLNVKSLCGTMDEWQTSSFGKSKKKKTPKNKQKMLSTVQLLITNSDKSKDKNKMGVKILFLIKKPHLLSKIWFMWMLCLVDSY